MLKHPSLALLFLPSLLNAQAFDPARLAEAAAGYAAVVESGAVKGAVLLVAHKGEVVLHEAYGVRDAAGEQPMRKDAIFRMASNTKPLTATAIMMLAEAGRLELDKPVGAYLPAFREGPAKAITLRQLLSHTSGWRINSLFLSPLMEKSAEHPDAPNLQLEVARFAEVAPEHAPGTTYAYNNPGFNTLAAVVERVSGKPFATFLAERVYGPLGMKDSGHREAEAEQERMSAVFRRRGGRLQPGWKPGDGNDLPFVRGSGGMVSTALDYLRFCQCILQGGQLGSTRILKPASVREMTRAQVLDFAFPGGNSRQNYGLGWRVSPGPGTFGHSGSDGTQAFIDPHHDIVCLVFTQTQGSTRHGQRFWDQVRAALRPERRPNVLLITADDLNRSSVGAYGCKVAGITPNIDRLAAQGIRFDHGHVNIAVCQPSRAVMLTGRYPFSNGARGFEAIAEGVATLSGTLHEHGYLTGIFGKTRHVKPDQAFRFEVSVPRAQLGEGRSPARYAAAMRGFLERKKRSGKPFFLMANTHDPHRPFAGSVQEQRQKRRRKRAFPPAPRTLTPAEVPVPGFLPQLDKVHEEIAQYFTSVHRGDAVVGALLEELDKAGLADDTLVLFVSDNGMALPFAKTNCYLHSTATPFILRWPGRIAKGQVDARHMVATVDWMPTVLDAVGLPQVGGIQGRSFMPLLRGEREFGRDEVLTFFYKTSGKRAYPMRGLQTRRLGYIVNAWADGQTRFRNESMSGLTFRAMQRAAAEDAAIKARVELFLLRTREELYDFSSDPDALQNLAGTPAASEDLRAMRERMQRFLARIEDPDAALFESR